jgi:Ca-dependent carbohydrate-binding module xylan-binding
MSIRVLAVAVVLAVGTASAADPVKFDLKDFKVKALGDDLGGLNEGDSKLFLYTNGTMTCEAEVPADGTYTLVVEMSCDEAKNEKAKVKISLGDDVVKDKFELTAADTKEYKFEVKAKKGKVKFVVEFLNDEFKEGEYDRNFYLHAARLEEKK